METSSNQSSRDRLFELLSLVCEDTHDAETVREIESLVLGDRSLRRVYTRYMFLHYQLHQGLFLPESSQNRLLTSLIDAAVTDIASPSRISLPQPPVEPPFPIRRIVAAVLAVAAAVVVAVGVAMYSGKNQPQARLPQPPAQVGEAATFAVLQSAADCEWSGSAPSVGDPLTGESLRLERGVARVRFDNGVQLTVEGPCQFAPVAAERVQLELGQLVALVPRQAIGFTVETRSAKFVDLGTEFGVNVDAAGIAEVHVFQGEIEVRRPVAAGGNAQPEAVRLRRSSALRITAADQLCVPLKVDQVRFQKLISPPAPPRFAGPVPLGNLFGDRNQAPMAEAVASDRFAATPSDTNLGIHLVRQGGGSIISINRDITFSFKQLGWSAESFSEIVNDAWGTQDEEGAHTGGIRTIGEKMASDVPKVEDGIGMHPNSLLTFDLDQIRVAAGWQGEPLRFVCDRAGVNDDKFGAPNSRFHMVALITDAKGQLTAYVNGRQVKVARGAGAWQIDEPLGKPITSDGQFVRFDFDLPPNATYLTLAVACAGNGIGSDHAVWSGAQLEGAGK